MKFQITYPDLGVTQTKVLIQHWKHLHGKAIKDEDERKRYYKSLGNYFTECSPLFDSMKTGILMCNGSFRVEFKRV